MGKGRRERVLPLWKETAAALKAWLAVRQASGNAELFLNATRLAMTRPGFEYIPAKHVTTAARTNYPSPTSASLRTSCATIYPTGLCRVALTVTVSV
nr:tyrosine-type recombinase/integrase [Mesorhizobium sp. AR07]